MVCSPPTNLKATRYSSPPDLLKQVVIVQKKPKGDPRPCSGKPFQDAVAVSPMPDWNITQTTTDSCTWDIVEKDTLEMSPYPWEKDETKCGWPTRGSGPAHTQLDTKQGSMIGFVQVVSNPPSLKPVGYDVYEVTKAEPSIRKSRVLVEAKGPFAELHPYFHSFALTANYVVLVEQPFMNGNLDPACFGKSATNCYKQVSGKPSVFRIVSRKTWKEVAMVTTDPFCYFHHSNAFEMTVDSEVKLIVDVVGYSGNACQDAMRALEVERILSGESKFMTAQRNSTYQRWEIPIKDGAHVSKPSLVGPRGVEMPTINWEEYNTRPYRYAYMVRAASDQSLMWDQLVKFDLKTQEVFFWHEENIVPMEPMFAKLPNSNSTAEDGGVVLSQCLNYATNTTFLLVLDAQGWNELGRWSLPTGAWIPYGFHGRYWNQ
eukprot:TRINITY_DN65182_c0_g1_i2.p2 TRINITY_DN65182_c0_g1~~TRINITY_DN65182_c0_g1_i2.p2  ORF type:complete len:430 (+),score=27.05 TRINITY_DN65182_c0_g1_i2:239-1528(+)